jgi:hypothetical protein
MDYDGGNSAAGDQPNQSTSSPRLSPDGSSLSYMSFFQAPGDLRRRDRPPGGSG